MSSEKTTVGKVRLTPTDPPPSQSVWAKIKTAIVQVITFGGIFTNRYYNAKMRQEEAKATLKNAEAVARLLEGIAAYNQSLANLNEANPNANKTTDPHVKRLIDAQNASPDEILANIERIVAQFDTNGGRVEIESSNDDRSAE